MKPESKFDPTSVKNLFLLKEDYRGKLPGWISRFLGYRVPGAVPPFDPPQVPPFIWLAKIPLHVEVWIFAWIGAFGAILLVEAIMSTSTVFRVLYSSPIVITSFGASAILLFGVIESPLAQPRNFVGGHLIAALTGTAVTRLFVLDPNYLGRLNNTAFDSIVFVNGGLSVATALAVMLVLGIVHPPAGSTALNAAVEFTVVSLSWRYLPVVLVSALIMQAWACVVNNLGRRRYPAYWWSPSKAYLRPSACGSADPGENLLRAVQVDSGCHTEGEAEQRG